MNNLNALKNKLEAMKKRFMSQHADFVVSCKMSVTDFAAMTHETVLSIALLEKVIKELSNGMYTFNSNGTVSVTYLSHFRNGRFHHDLEYKTAEFSFIECLMNLKGLNIDKHLLLKIVRSENELKTDTQKKVVGMKSLVIKTVSNVIYVVNGKVSCVRCVITGRFVAVKKFANIVNNLIVKAKNASNALSANNEFYYNIKLVCLID